MYQIMAEFEADLAEFARRWVPLGVREEASIDARILLLNNFTNDPGWMVGEPRPLP